MRSLRLACFLLLVAMMLDVTVLVVAHRLL